MAILVGSHGVSDYKAWLAAGREAMSDPERNKQFGILKSHAYRTADGNRVIVTHTFNTLDEAQKYQAMMDTPESHAMLEQNGAAPPYAFWVAEEINM